MKENNEQAEKVYTTLDAYQAGFLTLRSFIPMLIEQGAATFSKINQELVAKGFIDPCDKGGLRSDGKSYNLFKLSEQWKDYGKSDFKCLNLKCFSLKLSRTNTKLPEERLQQKNHELSMGKITREANYEQSINASKCY